MHPLPNTLLLPKVIHGLPEGHLIVTLVREHQQLLAWLDRLDVLIEDYRDAAGTPEARLIHAEIRTLAESLAGAEPHHAKRSTCYSRPSRRVASRCRRA